MGRCTVSRFALALIKEAENAKDWMRAVLFNKKGEPLQLVDFADPEPVLPTITAFKQVAIKLSMAHTLAEFQYCANRLDAGHVDPKLTISKVIAFEEVLELIVRLQRGETSEVKVHADTAL